MIFTHSSRVDPSTRCTHIVIHSQTVDEQYQSTRLEVCVSIQGHDIRVVIRYMLPLAVVVIRR